MIRRTSIVCLEVLLGVLVVLCLLVAGSAWRLSQGPVSIQFLLPYAEDLLRDRDLPYRTEVDDLILTWAGWERALDVRALGVRVVEKKSVLPAARIREVSVTLSVRALIDGQVTPTSLEVIRPRLRFVRDESGNIEFGFGEPPAGTNATAGDAANIDVLTLLLNELSGPARASSRLRYLNRVSVIGAVLRVEDRKMGIRWGARHADLSVERAPIGLRGAFDLDIDLRNSRPELHGEIYFDRGASAIDIDFNVTRINPALIAERFEKLADLAAVRAEMNGTAQARIGLDGDIERATFRVSSGSGSLTIPDLQQPPFAFRSIAIEGRINRNPDQIQIANATIDFGDTKGILSGIVTRVGTVAALNATLGIPEMATNDLKKYWPAGTGGGARAWVLANMRDGTYSDTTASLTARMPLEGDTAGELTVDSINGRINVKATTVDYLNPLPPIRNAAATVTFSDNRFDFAVHGGNVGDLRLGDSAITISGIGSPNEVLELSASIQGPVRAALDLLAHPRLKLLSRVGLQTAGAGGMHTTQLKMRFPLLDALKADEIVVESRSEITELALGNVLRDRGISGGTMSLSVTNESMRAAGTANYAGTGAEFDWWQDFSGKEPVQMRIAARATATAELRDLFEVYQRDRIEGPVPINLIFEDRRDGTQTFSAGLNFEDAAFTLPGFEWLKPAGTPATAKIALLLKDGNVASIPEFSIDAGEFKASGKLAFANTAGDTQPDVETVDLAQFVLGSTSFSATIRRAADRSLMIDVSGGGFDASQFFGESMGGIESTELPALSLSGTFGRFWIGQGAPASDVRMELQRDAQRWQRIAVEGALPDGGKAISIQMRPTGDGHRLSMYSADAGSLLKAMNVTDTIREGVIEISGTRVGGVDAPWRGTAEMREFSVADAPNFARLLTLASLTGINDTIAGKGISFDRLTLPYVFQNELATFSEARAVGSELGITATGTVDFAKDAIDLNGTIIPAYTINSLLGQIPVLGTILTGEKGGGIFAASYTVTGPVENPKMSVNPLSALAPGFLRKLLSGGGAGDAKNEGDTSDQDENNPARNRE